MTKTTVDMHARNPLAERKVYNNNNNDNIYRALIQVCSKRYLKVQKVNIGNETES